MHNTNQLLEIAKLEITKINIGEEFLLRDLFKGYEWNRIPRNERILLGTLFLNYVKSESNAIIALDKATSGQQKYKVSCRGGE